MENEQRQISPDQDLALTMMPILCSQRASRYVKNVGRKDLVSLNEALPDIWPGSG